MDTKPTEPTEYPTERKERKGYRISEIPLPSCADCMQNGSWDCMVPNLIRYHNGRLWFSLQLAGGSGGIGSMNLDGSDYRQFTDGFPEGSQVMGLAVGGDGNFWFTPFHSRKYGRMTPEGKVTTFSLYGNLHPKSSERLKPKADSSRKQLIELEALIQPYEIHSAPDGRLYLTVQDWIGGLEAHLTTGYVGRFFPEDPIESFEVFPVSGVPSGLAVGADGNVWSFAWHRWTDGQGGGITRITPDGEQTFYPRPHRDDELVPFYPATPAFTTAPIVFGADGNLWFVQEHIASVGRFNVADGTYEYFASGLSPETGVFGLVLGPDGAIYTVDGVTDPYTVLRIATDGTVERIASHSERSITTISVAGMVTVDNDIYFAAREADFIGKIEVLDS